jgi:hypothetical protein
MITFDEYFKLTVEASTRYSFNKFANKIHDRHTYLSVGRVKQSLDRLSNSGGLKILSLPHIFSFEKLLLERNFAVTDIYGAEFKLDVLKQEVLPAAFDLIKEQQVNVWMPYSKKFKRYVTSTISRVLDGKQALKNIKTNELKNIKDASVNVIDLDYIGVLDESKLTDIYLASKLLSAEGLLFVTVAFRTQKTGYKTDERIIPPFNPKDEAVFNNPAYNELAPAEDSSTPKVSYGLNMRKRQKYVAYAANVADYIANDFGKGLGLVPIYVNPYKGGDKSQAVEMMRIIFKKTPYIQNLYNVIANLQPGDDWHVFKSPIKRSSIRQFTSRLGTSINQFDFKYVDSDKMHISAIRRLGQQEHVINRRKLHTLRDIVINLEPGGDAYVFNPPTKRSSLEANIFRLKQPLNSYDIQFANKEKTLVTSIRKLKQGEERKTLTDRIRSLKPGESIDLTNYITSRGTPMNMANLKIAMKLAGENDFIKKFTINRDKSNSYIVSSITRKTDDQLKVAWKSLTNFLVNAKEGDVGDFSNSPYHVQTLYTAINRLRDKGININLSTLQVYKDSSNRIYKITKRF